MLLSSLCSSVLVAPTSLNTPGILFLPVLPKGRREEKNYCQAGLLQITVEREEGGGLPSRESGLLLFSPHQVAFSTWDSPRHSQIFTEADVLKSTWPAIICAPAEADVKRSWHRAGLAQRGERGREEAERWREREGSRLSRCLGTASPHAGGTTPVMLVDIPCFFSSSANPAKRLKPTMNWWH